MNSDLCWLKWIRSVPCCGQDFARHCKGLDIRVRGDHQNHQMHNPHIALDNDYAQLHPMFQFVPYKQEDTMKNQYLLHFHQKLLIAIYSSIERLIPGYDIDH